MLATKNDSQTCVISLVFFFFCNVFVFYQFSFTMSKKIKNLFAKKLVGSCFKARILMMLAPCSLNGPITGCERPNAHFKKSEQYF
jgi:hypothetical protein